MSDPFAAMAAQLADVAVPEVEDFTKLSDFDLAVRLNDIEEELRSLKEFRYQKTVRGRELHSIRSALLVETRNPKRG